MANKKFFANINAVGSSLSASTIYSGSTNLSNIFVTSEQLGTSGNLWSASTGTNSIIANNGSGNLASGVNSIAIGRNSSTSGNYSFVGGYNNIITGDNSFVGGGYSNENSGLRSFLGGGQKNKITGDFSFIGAGYHNSAITNYSIVIGGNGNLSSGLHSLISNGVNNTLTGQRSAIIGGQNITGTQNDTVYVPNLRSIGSISASTLYSGSTNLYDIFLTTADGNDITRVQNGINTYTGGTGNLPTVNVSGLTIDNINVSGISSFNSISATTIYSGSTDLSTLFTTQGGSGLTKTGTILNVNVDDSTIGINGSDNLYVKNYTAITGTIVTRTYYENGVNITGGTTYTLNHNLNTKAVIVSVYDEADDQEVEVAIKTNNFNSVDIDSNVTFTARIVAQG